VVGFYQGHIPQISPFGLFRQAQQAAEKVFGMSLRAKRSNLIDNRIKLFEIAAPLTLLAMNARIGFFRKLLV